jgi:phytol kinase
MNNWVAVLISFAYVFVTLGLAESLRRALKLPVEFTRKFVHISVGMWAWGTAALFTDKWYALICPASFILLNYISYKRGLFLAMESNDKSNLGTVYFPMAFVVVILLFFDSNKPLMIASLMPMTWGDAFAAIVGKQFGKRKYTVLGITRSLEGSAAMFAFSFLSLMAVSLVFVPTTNADWLMPALTGAVLTAVWVTVVEAITPGGLDNLIVPAATVALLALFGAFGGLA